MSKVTFNNKSNPFFKALKEKVDSYFENSNLTREGNRELFYKKYHSSQLCSNIICCAGLFYTIHYNIIFSLCIVRIKSGSARLQHHA